jgi:hypothetical protein
MERRPAQRAGTLSRMQILPMPPSEPNAKWWRHAEWAVVLAAYIACFGALLVATRGLPYAIDNNESFSSLWHARHMYELGFSETKGLADEVMAWHPAASPYVHTHQGNFPRLFSFLLYLLGARSMESQIVITTFTVGLAGIWLAYRFLCTIGPPLFAAACCLVLITDYGLFGQWQVNTYRVWYGVFFFGSLFWVSQLERHRRWPMLAAGVLLFAAVFYGEYVFATFVGITACGYALFIYPRRPRIFLRAWLAVVGGGAVAAGVLLTQLVAYMGWKDLKTDIGYTLAARNMARDQAFTEKVDAFYRDHRIIFWNNFFDITSFRTFGTFVSSLFEKHLQYYSPWVWLSATVILAGALLGLGRGGDGSPPPGDSHPDPRSLASVVATRVLPGIFLATCAFALLRFVQPLFDDSSEILWRSSLGLTPPAWMGWLAYVVSSVVALTLAVAGTTRLVGRGGGLPRLFLLSLCVTVAYGAVYRGFTGYIFSGYLNRQAPFLVFWTDTLLGGGLYLVLSIVLRGFAEATARQAPAILPIAASLLLAFFVGAWATLQLSYLIVVPPNGEPFLKLLTRYPFRGGTFVANDYPAPISEKTHAWAYADSTIFSGQVRLTPDGFAVEHDTHYLWFADGVVNAAYMKPDFGLLIDQPASISEALTEFTARIGHPAHAIAFDTLGIVKRTQEVLQPFLRQQLAATDGRSYSIVKFDWDFPPFLKPVDAATRAAALSMTFQQKLAFSETSQEQLRRWRVEIEPTDPQPAGARKGVPVLLSEASIDGRPIFSDAAFSAAGWTPGPPTRGRPGGAWIGTPGASGRVATVVVGDMLTLRLLEGPGRGVVKVAVDDMTEAIDLSKPVVAEHVISLSTAGAHDKYTVIPRLAPGTFVNTWLTAGTDGPSAVLGYTYAHQDGKPEEGTTVRVYDEPSAGQWRLAEAIYFLGPEGIPVRLDEFRLNNPDTLSEYARMLGVGEMRTYEQWLADHLRAYPGERNRVGILDADASFRVVPPDPGNPSSEYRTILLPRGLEGRVQISVTPSTRTKAGPEFFGQTFDAARIGAAERGRLDPVLADVPRNFSQRDLPYGYISLRLRFPSDQTLQAEPIVTSGVEEAGDFVFVIYPDATHIRIGFDHWFKGGPLSPPIPIDYAREHDIEVSMGSLFPPEEDIVYVGMGTKEVAELKGNIWVKLDGRTVLEAKSDFWDSPPTQVTVGRNEIKGTTSRERFTGQILECRRIWPNLQ